MSGSKARWLPWAIGAVAVVFGLMTLAAGGAVVFDVGTARADHGSYVPFVLYFNFLSGFAYIVAGVGVGLGKPWAAQVATAIAVGIAITSLGLGVHVVTGGAFETETVVAMSVRLALWLGISAYSWRRRS